MWWLTDQRRLQTERQAIEALDADWFQHPNWSVDGEFRLMLTFDLALARGRFPLRLTYHNTFPGVAPEHSSGRRRSAVVRSPIRPRR